MVSGLLLMFFFEGCCSVAVGALFVFCTVRLLRALTLPCMTGAVMASRRRTFFAWQEEF